jgi:hypothetical protein
MSPIGPDGQPMQKPKTPAALAIQTDDTLKLIFDEENKKRKAAGLPTLNLNDKHSILNQKLTNNSYKTFFDNTYPIKVQAQLQTPFAYNPLYTLNEDTLQFTLITPNYTS